MCVGGATLVFEVECISVEKKPSALFSSGTRRFLSILGIFVAIVLIVYEVYKKAKKESQRDKKDVTNKKRKGKRH